MLWSSLLSVVVYIAAAQTLNTILKPTPTASTEDTPHKPGVDSTARQTNQSDSLSQEELVSQCLKRSASALEHCRDEVAMSRNIYPLLILHSIWSLENGTTDPFLGGPKPNSTDKIKKLSKVFNGDCDCLQEYGRCCTSALCAECNTTVAANLLAYMSTTHWTIFKASAACGGIFTGLPCRGGGPGLRLSKSVVVTAGVLLVLVGLLVVGLVYVFIVKKDNQRPIEPLPAISPPPLPWIPASTFKQLPHRSLATDETKSNVKPSKSPNRPKSWLRRRSPYCEIKRKKSFKSPMYTWTIAASSQSQSSPMKPSVDMPNTSTLTSSVIVTKSNSTSEPAIQTDKVTGYSDS